MEVISKIVLLSLLIGSGCATERADLENDSNAVWSDARSVPTFECSGVAVPGRHANLQAAVDALAKNGGTICLDSGSFGDLSISSVMKKLQIIGVSEEVTELGTVNVSLNKGAVVMMGLAINDGLVVNAQTYQTPLHFVGEHIRVSGPTEAIEFHPVHARDFRVDLDGVTASAPNIGIYFVANHREFNSLTFNLKNSVIEGASTGLLLRSGAAEPYWNGIDATVVHNTFAENYQGIEATHLLKGSNISGNAFFNGNKGITQRDADLHFGPNAYWEMVSNYGSGVGPYGDTLGDPLLFDEDVLFPGALGAWAGAISKQTDLDFFGQPRPEQATFGAVEPLELAQDEVLDGESVHFDFEAEGPGLSMSGLWHITQKWSSEGDQAVWFGDEESGDYEGDSSGIGYLDLGPFELSDETPTVTWSQLLDVEELSQYDRAELQVFVAGTNEPQTVWEKGSVGTEFEQVQVGLSAFAGQTVTLRFAFDTVDMVFNDGIGWVIDDVRIDDGAPS